jgi:hypothetical protein
MLCCDGSGLRRLGFRSTIAGRLISRAGSALASEGEEMRRQTPSTRQQLLERQLALYVNESELPFTTPSIPDASRCQAAW